MPYGAICKLSAADLAELVKRFQSVSQLFRFIGCAPTTGNYRTLWKRINNAGVDASHFIRGKGGHYPKTDEHRYKISITKLEHYGIDKNTLLVNLQTGMKWCIRHKSCLPRNLFHKNRSGHCIECSRIVRFEKCYNLPYSWYEQKFKEQNGRCAVCKRTPEEASNKRLILELDHDHSCCAGATSCGRCARGLLCTRCNVLIGQIESNSNLLDAIKEYVNHYPLDNKIHM